MGYSAAQKYSDRKRWVACILCLFFGLFGAHLFYARRHGPGVLYVLTLGLFGIGWVADLVLLLLGVFWDVDRRRLR